MEIKFEDISHPNEAERDHYRGQVVIKAPFVRHAVVFNTECIGHEGDECTVRAEVAHDDNHRFPLKKRSQKAMTGNDIDALQIKLALDFLCQLRQEY